MLVVLMGHAGLLLLLWQGRLWPATSGDTRRALVLRWVAPVPPPTPRRVSTEVPPWPGVPVLTRPIAPPDFAVALPAPAGPGGDAAPAGSAAAAPAPALAASVGGALDLRPRADVLRGALANPATTDPRSNTPRPTFEERIAMGLDPDLCVKYERDAQGNVTRRMGRMARTLTHLQATQGVGAKDVRSCQ